MAETPVRTTVAKALKVNLDVERYGTFAEIGAGQEVARQFFLAGRASQTIAKSMSAYDMTYSDEIYGREKNGRYVCESRLVKMLQKESDLLVRRLDEKRGEKTSFFALANTVATGTSDKPRCHGWMGIKFQNHPRGEWNEIILHVRMMDRHRLQQQEALSVLGVNLIEAAFYNAKKPEDFLNALVENIKAGQIILDVLKFSGPDLKHYDNRVIQLELVRRGLAEAVLFGPQGDILNVSDTVYGKAVLMERGTFRPITITHVDVIEKGLKQMKDSFKKETKADVLPLMEMLMPAGTKAKDIEDFLQRIDLINRTGYHALVSCLPLHYQLKNFFRHSTNLPITMVMGASKLDRLFDQKHYANLDGGVLEGLGKLLDPQTKLFIYPHKTDKTCLTAKLFRPPAPYDKIYEFFLDQGQICDISACDQTGTYWHSNEVRKVVEKRERGWDKLVPSAAADLIKQRKLWTS